MGHQDYFLAPLPGSEALLVRGIGKENFNCKCCFYFCLLIFLIMERRNVAFLFGKSSTAAEVEHEAPPDDIVPFKIPMKIIERVMNNRYVGDGTVHPGDHLLYLHELCKLFKCAGITMDEVRKKLFSRSLGGRAAHWYKLLKNRDSFGWEEIVHLFYSKFYPPSEIHQDRNSIYNFWPHDG